MILDKVPRCDPGQVRERNFFLTPRVGSGRCRLCYPESRVAGYETDGVYLEAPHECTAARLVAICRFSLAAIHLREQRKIEGQERQPGRPHRDLLADGQREAANGEQVGGRAKPQVDVKAPFDSAALNSVQTPLPPRVHGYVQAYPALPDRTAYLGRVGPPGGVAGHGIVQFGRTLFARKQGSSGQLPAMVQFIERGDLVAGEVEPPPQNGLSGHWHLLDAFCGSAYGTGSQAEAM